MIDRQGGQIVIECDSCGAQFEARVEGLEGDACTDWDEVWPAAKSGGWKARKIANEWLQFCPDCEP
jgi:hypothetical protein